MKQYSRIVADSIRDSRVLSEIRVYFMSKDLQTLNGQNKRVLWAGRILECRSSGQNVKVWCRENGICEQTYYKLKRRLFEMAQAQKEVQFAEVTPMHPMHSGNMAVTVRIAGAKADICNGTDVAIVETGLRILKSC